MLITQLFSCSSKARTFDNFINQLGPFQTSCQMQFNFGHDTAVIRLGFQTSRTQFVDYKYIKIYYFERWLNR